MSRLSPDYIPDVGGRLQFDLLYQKIHHSISNVPRALPAMSELRVDALVARDLRQQYCRQQLSLAGKIILQVAGFDFGLGRYPAQDKFLVAFLDQNSAAYVNDPLAGLLAFFPNTGFTCVVAAECSVSTFHWDTPPTQSSFYCGLYTNTASQNQCW